MWQNIRLKTTWEERLILTHDLKGDCPSWWEKHDSEVFGGKSGKLLLVTFLADSGSKGIRLDPGSNYTFQSLDLSKPHCPAQLYLLKALSLPKIEFPAG